MSPAARRFEAIIAGYIRRSGPVDPAVEKLWFPPMVATYRRLVGLDHGRPPEQDVFAEAVVEQLSGAITDAHVARAGRAWTSLVVQHHALIVLDRPGWSVVWDDRLDMAYGVDVQVTVEGGLSVGLALSCPTPRSANEARRKADRWRHLPFPVRSLLVQERGFVAGDIWLYRESELVGAVVDAVLEQRAANAERDYLDGYQQGLRDAERDYLDGYQQGLRDAERGVTTP